MMQLMKCGHSANATTATKIDGKEVTYPVCAICIGTTPDALVVVAERDMPSIEGRQAKCSYDNPRNPSHKDSRIPSDTRLAFFAYRPDQEYDEYYCGCFGWD